MQPAFAWLRPQPRALKAGEQLIPIDRIERIDIERLEHGEVDIHTTGGAVHTAHGFDAIEAIWAFKPSAVEGRRLRWRPHAWAIHNLVTHPVVQLMAWAGLKQAAVAFHDRTTPKPRSFKTMTNPDAPAAAR